MKLRLLLFVCAAGLLASSVSAAPAPTDKNAGPVIAVQAKSIDQLLDTVKTTAKNFLPDPIYKEFEKEVLSKLDLNLIKGVDTKKPSGMYALLDSSLIQGDFSKSTVVLLVPVTTENDFIALLNRFEVKLEKKDGAFEIPIPNSPVNAIVRFQKGYAYISAGGDKLEARQSLLDPSEVIIAQETAALAMRLRLDRIPDEFKAAIQLGLGQAFEMAKGAGVPPEAKGMLNDYIKMVSRFIKMGLDDGKEFALRFDLDPKTGCLILEMTVDGKPSSALAKSIAGIKPTKNDFAGLVGSDSAAQVLFQVPLFIDEVQSILSQAVDLGAKSAEKDLPADEKAEVKEMVAQLFAAARRTVKSGNLDLAATLRGPDKDEVYAAIGVISLKETAPLEKAIKAALKVAKQPDKVKVDAYKVGDINVHEVLAADELPPEAQKVFGKSNVYVAFAPDAVFVSFGAQAKDVLKEALTTKLGPKPVPLASAEVSGKRMMTLIKNAGAPMDGTAGAFFDKFSQIERLPILSTKIEGGEKLVIRKEIGLLPFAGLTTVRAGVGPGAAPPKIEKK